MLRSRAFLYVALLLPLLALSACDDKKADNSQSKSPDATKTADTAKSPCSLLTGEEVAGIIGPLAGPPYRGQAGNPQPTSDNCRYETPDLHSVVASVAWTGGAQMIGVMGFVQGMVKESVAGQLKLIDGTTLAGEWDEARITGCCEFNALRGDQLVTIDIAGSHATIAQAAALADSALKRIDQPLAVDDAAGSRAALARADRRPKARSVCALLSRADVEAIAQVSLLTEPTGNENSCTYHIPLNGEGSDFTITLAVDWVDGFHEMRVTQSSIGNATSALGMNELFGQDKTGDDPADKKAAEAGPWDELAQSIVGVSAVKSDVLISTESGPLGQELVRALIAKAVENLNAPAAKP